jgi:hypothetical protein
VRQRKTAAEKASLTNIDLQIGEIAGWSQKKWLGISGFLLLVILASVIYISPRWQFFRSDDLPWIRSLQSSALLPTIWDQFSHGSPQEYRPFTSLYLLIVSWIFGDWAPGFYAANLLLHVASSTLVYGVARQLALSRLAGSLASLLFLVHPAPFRTILWINDSATLLQTHCTLWAVLFSFSYLAVKRPALQACSLLAALAAMFSKESGVIAVLLIPFIDVLFGPQPFAFRVRSHLVPFIALVGYLTLSLRFTPGWREYPEAFGWGPHVLPNLFYSIGFLVTMPDAYLHSGFPWTRILGALVLLAVFLAFEERRKGVFVAIWLLAGALPTALFVAPDSFGTTGRYTYSFLSPFALASAALMQRLDHVSGSKWQRWFRATASTVVIFVLISLSFKTARLAETPYETQAGPILYHYVVMALMEYREAERFLVAEIGCPSRRQLEDALDWAERLTQNRPTDPAWEVCGRMIVAITNVMLRHSEKAAEEFRRVIDVFDRRGKVELVRGAEVDRSRVEELAGLWTTAAPVYVCPSK